MRTLSLAFFVTLYLVFTHTNCGIKSSYLQKRRLKQRVQEKNQSEDVFVVFNSSEINRFEKTLVRDEHKGERCLKNLDECFKSGELTPCTLTFFRKGQRTSRHTFFGMSYAAWFHFFHFAFC